MTKTQRDSIASPATGLLIFQTNSTPGFYDFNGTAWAAVSPKGVNTTLSNLVSPTAVNQSLLPGTNNTIDLGSGTQAWRNGFFGTSVGIGTATPHAPFQLGNAVVNRKIVLFETANNDNQFYGFGINNLMLRYQVDGPGAVHAFYAGSSASTSVELMRIQGNGNVGIGTTAPDAPLQFANTLVNRKIVLYETANDDNNFFGFGINGSALRYQVGLTSSDHVFYASTSASSSVELMRIKGTGNVGIASAAPTNKLDIGDYSNNADTYLGIKTTGGGVHRAGIKLHHFNDNYGFDLVSDETVNGFYIKHHFNDSVGVNVLYIDGNNNVAIGTNTTSTGYKLTVAGKVICTELKVQLQPFPDYVFDKDYKLRSINEVADYIRTNQHLPNMPPAAEVEKNGMSVGEMQGKLVEKVEELTLYIIQQQKQIDELQKQINTLKK
jgi:hypothetical protein